ncbi:hypothetical protein [Proteiniborus sp. MB09-C3]|uniref:hypothetical protein n=1 Tax=Proteiniborus sp. MB09-C3 TaxID=3050072 RepID=UPI0025539E76|nr:hypothetical protein [Proteiniborus sp. MB09-C3]WIV11322.1 hypothetical protein QO263_14340 [Proteiniborus sp. MB09-C3]
MGFMNIHDVLIMDNKENIYSFYMYEKKIKMVLYDKNSEKAEKRILISDCLDEYDSTISEDGTVYLVCQKIDGSIVLVSIDGYKQEEHLLAEKFDAKLRNINIKVINDQIHIIYCVEANEGNNKFRIYHHSLLKDEWDTHIVTDITKREILNPISIIQLEDMVVMGYYDIVDNIEQVFVNTFSLADSQWSDKIQLTTDSSAKMYLDMLSQGNNEIDLCYSKLIDGNFVITYEKYNILNGEITRVTEHVLSNPANCMYPTFINSGGTLWTIWIEYDGLLSCFSEDRGLSWSSPYSWENSKKDDFARYKFSTNNSSIIDGYNFNYGFGTYGKSTSFIGFGDIQNAVEVPLKSQIKKKVDEEKIDELDILSERDVSRIEDNLIDIKENKEMKEIEELKVKLEGIEELKERVTIIEQALKTITEILENKISETSSQNQNIDTCEEKIIGIEKRVNDIEYFLSRRRRGFLMR